MKPKPAAQLPSLPLRVLEPEMLDALPPDHPDALRNRRDLRLLNHLLGNPRWWSRVLPRLVRPGERVLEVGAGVGELGARLHSRGVPVDGLDRWPRPPDWPAERRWHEADVEQFADWADYGVVMGNFIWHQFDAAQLAALGARMQAAGVRVFVAAEPARHRCFQWGWAVLARLLRAGPVSRHDGHVSIAAGFRGDELPHALGLDAAEWRWRGHTTLLGMHRLVAWRRGGPPSREDGA